MAHKRYNQIERACQKEHAQYHELDDMILAMLNVIIHEYKIHKHCFIYPTYYSYSYHKLDDWKDVGAAFYHKGLSKYNNRPTIIIFIKTLRDYVLEIKNEARQQNVADWHKVVYKQLLQVMLHEFRHYQQYKYFKDNGLDFHDYLYILKMNDIPYEEEMTETDAILYSEDPENSGSLNFLIMDYCVRKIQYLQKLIKEESGDEEKYEEQIQELYEIGRKFTDHKEINDFCKSSNEKCKDTTAYRDN